MNLIHVVGRKNNGKTRLIVELIDQLRQRGIRVGTVKHSSHVHELDKPGKDSHLHRMAGGNPVAVVTADQIAVYMSRPEHIDPISYLSSLFENTDLILVEGHVHGPGRKIEVWRKEIGVSPLVKERNDIEAVITDDPIDTPVPVWPRSDIARIADNVCRLASI